MSGMAIDWELREQGPVDAVHSALLLPGGMGSAGSFAELTLVYTAGTFGIDDTGMVKISWRTTSDTLLVPFAAVGPTDTLCGKMAAVLYQIPRPSQYNGIF